MSLYNDFIKKLNESSEVKKTYGDVPQEGKTEKLAKGKKVSIPTGKSKPKYTITKLKNVNKQATDAYVNDTDRVIDTITDKKHSDKGTAAKVNTKKAERKVKFPFGDKPEKSDSKLIKENEEVKECDKTEGFKTLKEDYDNGTWMKHQDAIENELMAAKEEMDEDAFLDFIDGVINLCQNYNGELNQLEGCSPKKEIRK